MKIMTDPPAPRSSLLKLLDWSDRDKCLLLSVLLWGYMFFICVWHQVTVHLTEFGRNYVSSQGTAMLNSVVLINLLGWALLLAWGGWLRHENRHSRIYPNVFLSFFSVGFVLLGWVFGLYSPMTGMVLMGSPLVGFILFGFTRVAWNFAFTVCVVLLLAWLSVSGYVEHAIYFARDPVSKQHLSYYWIASTVAFMVPFITSVITLVALLLGRWVHREKQIRDQALHDPLTGLSNRRELFAQLAHELARGRRSGQSLTLCVMDLDHFKRINDSHGHGVGDQVLVQVSEILRACLRETDLIGRIGGEEFVLALPETGAAGAATVLERCRETIASSPVPLESGDFLTVTASFGAVLWLPGHPANHALTDTQLLSRADEALYLAKGAGRNRVMFWSQEEEGAAAFP